MDLNFLLHRHQVSLMRASRADGAEARDAHRRLTTVYAELVDDWSVRRGANAAPLVRA